MNTYLYKKQLSYQYKTHSSWDHVATSSYEVELAHNEATV